MNYKVILHTLGVVLCFEAACMLLPLGCALIYGESDWSVFLISIAISLAVGAILFSLKPKNKNFYAKEGYAIVALSWILMSIFGSLPFILSGSINGFVPALFETVSGFTTTGATGISDVEALSKSVLFWRSFTHWIGGMGVLVFLLVLLPTSGGSNFFLMKAESPGPSVGKLVPRVRSSAKILYLIYLCLTLVQIIFLWAGEMDLFEAITHTFGTAGTGGFGIKNSSIAEYSTYSQVVITVFMILFGIDFSVYYLLLMRKFASALRSEEVRTYLGIILIAITIICINCYKLFENIGECIKHAAFQVASIFTTSGYATVDFDAWPELSKAILLLLMFVGACAGSTGGGIKVSRIIIFLKSIAKEIKLAAHPKSMHKIHMNGRIVEHETVRMVNVYMAAYLLIFFVSILLVSINNFDFTTNVTAVAATLNNVGPGMSLVGPTKNFALFSPFSQLVLIFDMLAGRLEIFPVLILFAREAWKK